MKLIEKIKDWYLTRKTGLTASERAWMQWLSETVNHRARTVQDKYKNFKYIIPVNSFRVMNYADPIGWSLVDDLKKYTYPTRPLGDNLVWTWARGDWDQWDKQFHFNDISGGDQLFLATNNERDAIIISLKYM